MASRRPPMTYSRSARTGRRSEGSGGVVGVIRRAGCDERPRFLRSSEPVDSRRGRPRGSDVRAPAGDPQCARPERRARSNYRSWEPRFKYRHTRPQPARTSRRRFQPFIDTSWSTSRGVSESPSPGCTSTATRAPVRRPPCRPSPRAPTATVCRRRGSRRRRRAPRSPPRWIIRAPVCRSLPAARRPLHREYRVVEPRVPVPDRRRVWG